MSLRPSTEDLLHPHPISSPASLISPKSQHSGLMVSALPPAICHGCSAHKEGSTLPHVQTYSDLSFLPQNAASGWCSFFCWKLLPHKAARPQLKMQMPQAHATGPCLRSPHICPNNIPQRLAQPFGRARVLAWIPPSPCVLGWGLPSPHLTCGHHRGGCPLDPVTDLHSSSHLRDGSSGI